jgi:hypothetical protein
VNVGLVDPFPPEAQVGQLDVRGPVDVEQVELAKVAHAQLDQGRGKHALGGQGQLRYARAKLDISAPPACSSTKISPLGKTRFAPLPMPLYVVIAELIPAVF